MKNLRFVQVEKGNELHFEEFRNLMLPYYAELDSHKPQKEPMTEEKL